MSRPRPMLTPAEARRARRQLALQDPVLGRLLARAGPFALEIDELHSPFDSLMSSIVHQQLHGKAAASILARTRALFDGGATPEQILHAPVARLRGAGLSGSKTAALKDLAAKTLDGTVPTLARLRRMEDEAIVEALTAIRGIGRWTVEMMLMFRLGRPDVLPATDFGVRHGFSLTFRPRRMPAPKELLRRGERWRPYRSIAAWYLWRAVDLSRSTAPPARPTK